MIDFRDLIKAGIHFGHQKSRWNPKMAPFIWGYKSGIHLVDVSKTAQALERASKFLEEVAAKGEQILWVGTKKSAQKVIEKNALVLEMPYVSNRWIGGTLTNFSQVKKSVTKLLHFEDVLVRSDNYPYKKKELLMYQKNVDRLKNNVGGICKLKWPIGALVVVDVKHEQTALREAQVAGIPVVALVDTNCDPSMVDYVIPGNDDSPKAVELIVNYLTEATKRGIEKVKKAEAKEKAAINEAKVAKKVDKEVKASDKSVKKEAAEKPEVKKEVKAAPKKEVAEKKEVVKEVAKPVKETPAKKTAPVKKEAKAKVVTVDEDKKELKKAAPKKEVAAKKEVVEKKEEAK